MPKVTPKKAPLRRTFLREWREFRGLSQERAAERIGIDRSQLSKIESGKNPYNQPFLEAAAVAYMCEPPDLLIRNPKDKSAIWSLIESVKAVPASEHERVRDLIKIITKTGT